jgi:hypothetical protein
MLNSLYGRFGMKEHIEKTRILDIEEVNKLIKSHRISEIHSIVDSSKELVRYSILPEKEICLETGVDFEKELLKFDSKNTKYNISIAIAAAVSSYSRIIMNSFKHLPGNRPLYSDTDSISLEQPLDAKFIGKELGQMKLESIAEKAYFVAPKLYYLQINKNDSIIKAKGIGPIMKKEDFLNLYNGKDVTVSKEFGGTRYSSRRNKNY